MWLNILLNDGGINKYGHNRLGLDINIHFIEKLFLKTRNIYAEATHLGGASIETQKSNTFDFSK